MKISLNLYSSHWLLYPGLFLMAVFLTGCVTPVPLEKEVPTLTYKATDPILVSVLDERDVLKEGKPATYIGRAQGMFGIPSDMHAYPWFVSDKNKKEQSLAQALEERIVVGLSNEGWRLASARITTRPTKDEAAKLLKSNGAQHLILLSITHWFTSINLNWVSAFNFEWGYMLDILDTKGIVLDSITDRGVDVVDEQATQSYQNMIKMAFRERLIKILERPELQAALRTERKVVNTPPQPSSQTSRATNNTIPDRTTKQQKSEPVSKPVYETNSSLRPVTVTERNNCELIASINRSAGGSGDSSKYATRAIDTALTDAERKGADSYFLVKAEETDSGFSVVLDALKCK